MVRVRARVGVRARVRVRVRVRVGVRVRVSIRGGERHQRPDYTKDATVCGGMW